MAQHFHIEAPCFVDADYRIEPTMSRAARLAKMSRIAKMNKRFEALSNANRKAREIKRDIEREIKSINQ